MGADITVEATFISNVDIRRPIYAILFKDIYGNTVLRSHSSISAVDVPSFNKGEGKIRCIFFNLPLMHGIYSIALWLGKPNQCFDYIEDVARVKIEPKAS